MMQEPGLYAWRNPWFRWSLLSVGGTFVAAVLVGFLWLPSAQSDFSAQGIWASICRAAGVPGAWGDQAATAPQGVRTTGVVLNQAMARPGARDAAGRGATLALQQCTMCHGARGVSVANAPSLAGQYPEVVIKQMTDYQQGDRLSSIMQALARNLSERDIADLATYYAELPRPRPLAGRLNVVPALVRVGDPMRNIAPCASCHGGVERKLGSPWLDGMPKDYLAVQLSAFASGARKNDSHAQMRNMARQLSAKESEDLASYYARP